MKDFILYPEAFKLKQLGFDEPCFGWFRNTEFTISFNDLYPKERGEEIKIIAAPTYSQAFRWFRHKGIISEIHSDFDRMLGYNRGYIPVVQFIEFYNNGDCYETYEEAELECLKKLIEIVKNK